jgi:hypothetical protein
MSILVMLSMEAKWETCVYCAEHGRQEEARLRRGFDLLRPHIRWLSGLGHSSPPSRAGSHRSGITRPISARRNVTFGAACRGHPLQHEQARPPPDPAQARRAAARRPGGLGHPACPARELPQAACQRRARHLADRQPLAGGASSSATGGRPGTRPGPSTGPQPSTCATSSAGA